MGDGLSDGAEIGVHGSDPNSVDGDGDGFSDADEVTAGTHPANSSIYPGYDLPVFIGAIRQLNAPGSRMYNAELSTLFSHGAIDIAHIFLYVRIGLQKWITRIRR